MRIKVAVTLTLSICIHSPALGDEIESGSKTEAFREHIRIIPSELASPWTDARPWLIGGTAATALLFAFKDSVGDPFQKSFSRNKPLGDWSKLGDTGGRGITNSLYAIGMLTHWYFSHEARSLERAILMFKLTFYSTNITRIMKYSFREMRPNQEDSKSFPSGHATAAFAFASFVAAEHAWPYGVAALSLAVLTGLSRINDNAHYLHDVVGGATVGAVYGLGLSYFHSRYRGRDKGEIQTGLKLEFMPFYSSEAKGLAVSAAF